MFKELIDAICQIFNNTPIKYNNKIKTQEILQPKQEINTLNTTKETYKYKQYYKPKRYVISKNELKFYSILLEIAKELNLIVFAQVSLYNILETRPNLDYKTRITYFNKIASKSIDFVLVDKENCRIKLCIELDDCTHQKPERVNRDIFINQLFKELEIDLLRYPAYKVYYKETLKKKIQESIKDHYYKD